MPYKVGIYFDKAYASITVKDWLSDSICVDTPNDTKLENVAVKASDTFQVLIGQKDNLGGVIIYDTAGVTPVPTNYDIPAELDAKGRIRFSKPKFALQSDLDNLDAQVKNLTQQLAGNKPGK